MRFTPIVSYWQLTLILTSLMLDFGIASLSMSSSSNLKSEKLTGAALFKIGGTIRANWKLQLMDIPKNKIDANQRKLFNNIVAYNVHQELLALYEEEKKLGKKARPNHIIKRQHLKSYDAFSKSAYEREAVIIGARVQAYDMAGKLVAFDTTNESGTFELELKNQLKYKIVIAHDDYFKTFLICDSKTPNPGKYEGASFNLVMYRKGNRRIPKEAFDIPYSRLKYDPEKGFQFVQNEEFSKALNKKMAVAIGNAQYYPGKSIAAESDILLFRNGDLYLAFKTSKKKGSFSAYMQFNEEYKIVVKSKREGYSEGIASISTKSIPKEIQNEDVQFGLTIKLYKVDLINKHGLQGIPLSKYYFDSKTNTLIEDPGYKKKIELILEGKGIARDLLKTEFEKLISINSPLENRNSDNVEQQLLTKEQIEEILLENKIKKITRSKEAKVSYLKEDRQDEQIALKTVENRRLKKSLYAHLNGLKTHISIDSMVVHDTPNYFEFNLSFGFSNFKMTRLDRFLSSVTLTKKEYYGLLVNHYFNKQKISKTDYQFVLEQK